jgi:hypothetical protein
VGPWVVGRAYWLVCSVGRLALYPLLLLLGWAWLWLRERGGRGGRAVWRAHGPQGLHRVGQQLAALAGQYLAAALLAALAVGVVLYGLAQHAG